MAIIFIDQWNKFDEMIKNTFLRRRETEIFEKIVLNLNDLKNLGTIALEFYS